MKKKVLMIAFALFLALTCAATFANAATFGWDANTEPDLAGYRLYRAPATGNLPAPTCGVWTQAQQFGLVTTGVDVPPNGRWCYVLTAIDNAWPTSNESGQSNRVYLQVPTDTVAPMVPAGTFRVVAP